MKKALLVITLAVLILAACGSPVTEAPAKPRRTKTAPIWSSIKMTQSGGLAGVSRIITVSRDGLGSAIDERAGKNMAITLSAEQVAQLDSIVLSSMNLPEITLDVNCADCFIYTLEVTFPKKTGVVQVSDTQLATSGYEPLVTFLRALLDATLQ